MPPWTGPWADDVRRIFDIVQGHLGGPKAASAPGVDPDPVATHPPDCVYCPICQGIALVRRSGPETLDRIAELAAGLAATLRATDPGRRPAEGAAGGFTNTGSAAAEGDPARASRDPAAARATAPTTVRIDVTD